MERRRPRFYRKNDLAREYGISLATVCRVQKFIENHPETYPKDAVFRVGRSVSIRWDAFEDAAWRKDCVELNKAPKFIPQF